jgi:autotransporter translocation and assembly factor TamB
MNENAINRPDKFRWLKRSGWFAILLALFILAALLLMRFIATTGAGHRFIEKRIEAAAPSGQSIQMDGIDGDLLGTFTIKTLTVSDAKGVWLTARNAKLDWTPFALTRRHLLIRDLAADDISVIRRPIIVSTDKPESADKESDLPIRLATLESLAIKRFALTGDVTPQPVEVSIKGKARVAAKNGKLNLKVMPTGTSGDRLSADLAWSEARPLNGTLDLTAPAGGLFASLARLDPEQELTATLRASGTLDTWNARAIAYVNKNPAIRLEATSTPSETDNIVRFSGQANPNLHPLTEKQSGWLGNAMVADGTVRLVGDGPLIDATITGANQSLRTTAKLSEGTLTADIHLEADDLQELLTEPSFELENISLDGILTRTKETLGFVGTAEAAALKLDDGRIDLLRGPLTLSRQGGVTSVQTDLSGQGISLSSSTEGLLGTSPSLTLDVAYTEETKDITIGTATLNSPNLKINTKGQIKLAETLSADLSGALSIDRKGNADIRPIETSASWSARTRPNGNIAFNIDGAATNLGDLPTPLDQWVKGPTTYKMSGTRTAGGAISVPSIKLKSAHLDLSGSATRSEKGNLAFKLAAAAGSAKIGPSSLSGLTANLTANGSLDMLDYSGTINTPQLSAAGAQLRNLVLTLNGEYSSGNLTSALNLTATSDHAPLTATSNVSLMNSIWQATETKMNWGELTATANLSGEGGDISKLRGTAIAKGALPAFIPADAIDFTGKLQGETLIASLALDKLTAGPLRDTSVDMTLNGTTASASYTLAIEGTSIISELERPLTAEFAGTLMDVLTQQRRVTTDANVSIGKIEIVNRAPIKLSQSPRGVEISANLDAFGGQIKLEVSDAPTQRLSLQLSELALADILTFAGRTAVTGQLDGTALLQDLGPNLTGNFKGNLTELQQSSGTISPVTFAIDGQIENEHLRVDLLTDDATGLTGHANVSLPVKTSAMPLRLSPAQDAALTFSADLDGDIAGIASVLAPPALVVGGELDLDITGSLPLSRGDLQGALTMNEGRFEHGDAGIVIQDIALASRITSGAVTLDRFKALGRDGGTLTGAGILHFADTSASTLTLTADKLVVAKRREGRATASGQLKLSYTDDLFSLGGDLIINDALVNLDALPKGGKPTLDVIFRNPTAPEQPEKEYKRATKLDVSITSKRGIKLRGQGVDAEAGLNAALTGTFSDPIIVGKAEIIRGRFSLLGKRFVFQDSTITMNGDPMAATLNITAAREADDITAYVGVSGTPRRPQIDLSAEPDVPEDEVLSRILFGRSPSELSALEAARLATALTQLSGGKGFDLLGGLEDSLGLDTLDLGQSQAGDFEVTTGKYISNDVYVELTTGSDGNPGLSLEWEPLDNITIGAETIPGEGQDVSIKWKRDFD